jgi:hypothetical protein
MNCLVVRCTLLYLFIVSESLLKYVPHTVLNKQLITAFSQNSVPSFGMSLSTFIWKKYGPDQMNFDNML